MDRDALVEAMRKAADNEFIPEQRMSAAIAVADAAIKEECAQVADAKREQYAAQADRCRVGSDAEIAALARQHAAACIATAIRARSS